MNSQTNFNYQIRISENQIEDAFVANLSSLQKIIKSDNEIRLIARQLKLKGGSQRIDLLVSNGKELCLIELKAVEFHEDFLFQIQNYRKELLALQENGELLSGKINSYLLVTGVSLKQKELALKKNIEVLVFNPIEVLTDYYKELSGMADFFEIKPNDYGIMNLGKINPILFELSNGIFDIKDISLKLNFSSYSIQHHLKLAIEFGLALKRNGKYFLTDMGNFYVASVESGILSENLSLNQIEILKKHIAHNPFYSSSVFGIYALLESVFLLARNKYPIELKDLKQVFRIVGGKMTQWRSDRSLTTATYTFLSFAIDLELLGKFGKQIVITPSGFKFILMLQLHKSIGLIESLNSNKN